MVESTSPQDRSEAKRRRQAQASESGEGKAQPGSDEHEAGGPGLAG